MKNPGRHADLSFPHMHIRQPLVPRRQPLPCNACVTLQKLPNKSSSSAGSPVQAVRLELQVFCIRRRRVGAAPIPDCHCCGVVVRAEVRPQRGQPGLLAKTTPTSVCKTLWRAHAAVALPAQATAALQTLKHANGCAMPAALSTAHSTALGASQPTQEGVNDGAPPLIDLQGLNCCGRPVQRCPSTRRQQRRTGLW